MRKFTITGKIVDVVHRRIVSGTLAVHGDRIVEIHLAEDNPSDPYILPGFIDAHVHVESSMLVPSEFARLAVPHGTVGTVSDPHEIANVLGVEGVRFMLQNAEKVPFHFFFGASSCVPATSFETAGAVLDVEQIRALFVDDDLKYLSEVMNYPGVLHRDPSVMAKIEVAKELKRAVDGHAPGLKGEEARRYIEAGITTDHECFTLEEALDKLKYGMHILIREGSAAKNYEALHTLIRTHPEKIMFCSDDKHPHELVRGHINELVRRSVVDKGYEVMDVLRAASYNPVKHYGLDVGLLQEGDQADFILVNNLRDFKVLETYVSGQLVAKDGQTLIHSVPVTPINRFSTSIKSPNQFAIKAESREIHVIEALSGQLITHKLRLPAKVDRGHYVSDVSRDILKLTVVNRYQDVPPAIAFVKGFGLKKGAIASCVAHDSHNIIAVGTTDEDLCRAVNALIEAKGGIAVVSDAGVSVLPLPVAGIMSGDEGHKVANLYSDIDKKAKALGGTLEAPYMTLSFMALLVIPSLKLSDKGLFDGDKFEFVSVSAG